MAVTDEASVAEQRMRARSKLIQEGVDTLPQRVPVVGQPMQFEYVLPQPAPQLLDRVEPGGVGWQPDDLQSRQGSQGRLYIVMVMDRPVVLDDIDALSPRIDAIQLPIE